MRKHRTRHSLPANGGDNAHVNSTNAVNITKKMLNNSDGNGIFLKSTCIPLHKLSLITKDQSNLPQKSDKSKNGISISNSILKSKRGADTERVVKRSSSKSLSRTSTPSIGNNNNNASIKPKSNSVKKSSNSMVYRHGLINQNHKRLTTHVIQQSVGFSKKYSFTSIDYVDDSYIDVMESERADFDHGDYKLLVNNGIVDKRRMSRRSTESTIIDGKHPKLDLQNKRNDLLDINHVSDLNLDTKCDSEEKIPSEGDNSNENNLYAKFTANCKLDNVLGDSKPSHESLYSSSSKSPESSFVPRAISKDMLFSIAELIMPYCTDKSADDIINALSQAKSEYERQNKIIGADCSLLAQNDNSLDKNASEKVLFDFFKKKSARRPSPYSSQNSTRVIKRKNDGGCVINNSCSQNASIVSPTVPVQQHASGGLSRVARKKSKSMNQYNLNIKSLRVKEKHMALSPSQAGESKKIEVQVWNNLGSLTILVGRALGQGSFAKVFPARLSITNNGNDSGIDTANSSASNSRVGNEIDPFQLCLKCIDRGRLECALKKLVANSTNRRMQYIREREMMRHTNPHIMRPLACRFFSNGSKSFQIIMPRARGDLSSMLKSLYTFRANQLFLHYTQMKREGCKVSEDFRVGLTEGEIKFLMLQILSGYAFLQTAFQGNVIRHSDIKLANVLVFCGQFDKYNPMKWNIKLADFGSSLLLHPTQHFTDNECMLQLTNALITEWVNETCNQIKSLVQGTIRFNAPEALTHDKHGSHRSNHNKNLIHAYESLYGPLDKVISEYNQAPRVWGVVEKVDTDGRYPTSAPFVPGADIHDIAEYSLVDSRADMWSIGMLLAELIRGCSFEAEMPEIVPTCLSESEYNSSCRASLNRKAKRLGDLLGSGLFPVRDGMTDREVNRIMALEIGKCSGTKAEIEAYIRSLYNECDMPNLDASFWDLFLSFFVHKPHKRIVAAEALGHKWFCLTDCPMHKDYSKKSGRSLSHFDRIDSLPRHLNHNVLEHSISINNVAIKCNSWFSGAWIYHNLSHNGEYDQSNPLHQLYRKEASVLESREKIFWGKTGAVLSALIKLNDSKVCDMTSTLASHVLGHSLGMYKKGL